MPASTSMHDRSAGRPAWSDMIGRLLTTGAVAGLVAGFTFILANMIYVTSQGMPAISPFLAIGTIFFFDDAPQMSLNYAITGVITHFSLAILFGMVFAAFVPLLRNWIALVAGAFVYGGLLYVINFLVFGNLIFEWFAPGNGGPDQVFELIVHPTTYGLVLVPFFLDFVRRGARTTETAGARDDEGFAAERPTARTAATAR
jgi:hypothetical protein